MNYFVTITLAAALTFSFNAYSQTQAQINAKKTNTTLTSGVKKTSWNCKPCVCGNNQNIIKGKKDYLFVLTAHKGSFSSLKDNRYELALKGVYPHVLFFGNDEVSKTGTLFASSFLTKLKSSVLDDKYPTTMRIKLYRGGDWSEQLAQPLEVKVISIEKIERTNWKFIVQPAFKGSMDGVSNIIYPDFYIFNSDLPGKGFIGS